jgi:uncharacterized protein with NAD-binding domain and iron-sulfur cluster
MHATSDIPARKQKIAVLGGGMAALTAVFELTDRPGHEDRYEITVYQVGHRLGGKGASGRNERHAQRIEEHGLHILMGFYHNAFSVLRRCYDELGRAPGAPLATIDDAVKPQDLIVIADEVDGRWEPWPLRFPPLSGKPGIDAPEPLHPLGDLKKILAWMHQVFTDQQKAARLAPGLDEDEADVYTRLGGHRRPRAHRGGALRGDRGAVPADPADDARGLDPHMIDPAELTALIDGLDGTRAFVPLPAYLYLSKLAGEVDLLGLGPRVRWLLERFRTWLWNGVREKITRSTTLRRLWCLLDLGLTVVIGALADGVLHAPEGWFSLDDLDLGAWLEKHGASAVLRDGALVRSLYNLAFTAPGNLAAGAMTHAALRMVLDYKGGIFQKMQAGMGDVVFAPLYQVLARRGVKFEFFHRVDDLRVSPDGARIEAVEMSRQVRVKGATYAPLRDVGGLPCWPSEPLYEALEDGESLRASGQNLESWWTTWPIAERLQLKAGRDFDTVLLGISIGAFPFVCKDLIARNERFKAMVDHVKTTQTQAVQLWFEGDLASLGWQLGPPVLDGFAAPFDTWADMSHLLPLEQWPAEGAPRNVAYLCSRLEDDEEVPPQADAGYPARQKERVKANALGWLNEHAHGLWPEAARAHREGGFAWGKLVDPEHRRGVERLAGQYWQATYCPSERFVLAAPGSTKHRLRAGESGFENLVMAGDWVRTGMNVGCVEGATMGGMQAARVISGWPERIVGDE